MIRADERAIPQGECSGWANEICEPFGWV